MAMNILIIDNHTEHIDELVGTFNEKTVTVRDYQSYTSKEVAWADMYVLSGGDRPTTNDKNFDKEMDVILSANKPTIGICAGFEVIAIACGNQLKEMPEKYRGLNTIHLNTKYFDTPEAEVFEAHSWSLSTRNNLEVLAKSALGPEIIKVIGRPIVGLQFHPEVTDPQNDGKAILRQVITHLLE